VVLEEVSKDTAFLEEKDLEDVSVPKSRLRWRFCAAQSFFSLLTITTTLVAYLRLPTDDQCARQLSPYCTCLRMSLCDVYSSSQLGLTYLQLLLLKPAWSNTHLPSSRILLSRNLNIAALQPQGPRKRGGNYGMVSSMGNSSCFATLNTVPLRSFYSGAKRQALSSGQIYRRLGNRAASARSQ
jgi:hypothetical protein